MKKVNEGGTVEVVCGEAFRVIRQERPGGYQTTLRPVDGLRHEGSERIPPENPHLIGGGVTIEEEYLALEPGEHEMVFRIARPWEEGGEDVVTRILAVGVRLTAADCRLDGARIEADRIPALSSAEIARTIGPSEAGLGGVSVDDFTWNSEQIPLEMLVACNQDGAEPGGGWKAAYERHRASDGRAVLDGSPAYAGRQTWLKEWARQTEIYPIYPIEDDGAYFMVDGHHRLAGAHFHDAPFVWAFVGRAKGKSQ